MDLTLNDDQQLIRQTAARFVSDVGRPSPGAREFDRELWSQIAEMGWLAVGLSEELGGFGSAIEIALIAEELGRGRRAASYLGSLMAVQLLAASDPGSERDRLLERAIAGDTVVVAAIAERDGRGDLDKVSTTAVAHAGGWSLTGSKALVLNGDAADCYVVSAACERGEHRTDPALFMVEASARGVTRQPVQLVDGSTAASVKFDGTPAAMLCGPDRGRHALSAMREQAIVAIVAESLGMMEAVESLTAEYFRTRQQFGRYLGEFQVLQHRLADMTIEAEMGRAALLVALAAFEIDEPGLRARRFGGAKAAMGEALRRVTASGVQVHGGMGMTQEYPVGGYLQRMVVLDAVLGSPARNWSECAHRLLEGAD